MSIVRADNDESATRVDRMIAEFRRAQCRRNARAITVKGDDRVVQRKRDDHTQPAIAAATPSALTVERE
jgi:electron transfer flavoprotein alpha/beta subunit